MGVVNVKESWKGSGLGRSEDRRTGRRMFTVLTDAVPTASGLEEILTAPGIPRLGQDTWPGDEWLRVKSVGPANAIGPLLYAVPVGYEREGDGQNASPLEDPPDISWQTVTSTEQMDFDAEGNAITNSVGERFDPPPAFEVVDRKLTYVRNEAAFDTVAAAEFDNVTNSTEFLGWAPGTVLCKPITATNQREGDLTYARVNYEFHFRVGLPAGVTGGGPENAWTKRVLNQGTRERVFVDGVAQVNDDENKSPKYRTLTGDDKNPLAEPVNLDAEGKPLAAGADPVWITVVQYEAKDLGQLGIELR